jgi:OmpA-OmpF porin, OOP family
MSRTLLCFFTLFVATKLFSQSKDEYHHVSTLGVNFILNDFENGSAFNQLSKADPGLSISFLKGIDRHLDYLVSLSGSFPDSISRHAGTNEKSLLLQGEISIHARLLAKENWFNPYLQAGAGMGTYQGGLHSYFLLGPGIELAYKDVYLTMSFQYRPSFSDNLNSHFYYSLGVSGLIGKKTKKKPVATKFSPVEAIVVRDSDGDGIVDSADACPNVPGLMKYHGCPLPDRDRDGIADDEDQCPDIAGILKYHGCPVPDTDGDGINDELDSCITVPGIPENHGCPPIKKEIEKKISLAAKNTFFKVGSYELLQKSFSSLYEVVKILNENPSFTLTIEGHTDNVGTEQSNQLLSENRANAVKQYLINNGVDKNRLSSIGFGQARPIDTNTTTEGRANNRRVELKLNFKP